MNIALIAHDSKKKLMQNFCVAYRGILSKNELYATGTTGRLIEEVTNLSIHKFLAGHLGGEQQGRISGSAARAGRFLEAGHVGGDGRIRRERGRTADGRAARGARGNRRHGSACADASAGAAQADEFVLLCLSRAVRSGGERVHASARGGRSRGVDDARAD